MQSTPAANLPTASAAPGHWSPFLPFAVLLHLGLLIAWILGGQSRSSAISLQTMVAVARWFPGSNSHPLAMWGVLSGIAGVLLALGVLLNSYHTRAAGWIWGSLTLTFIAMSLAIEAVRDSRAGIGGPIYVFTLVGAHVAAGTREKDG